MVYYVGVLGSAVYWKVDKQGAEDDTGDGLGRVW